MEGFRDAVKRPRARHRRHGFAAFRPYSCRRSEAGEPARHTGRTWRTIRYVLGESRISISGGEQLDGVTQGDGTHLLGHTITIDAPDWQEFRINDNDPFFEDNDSGQKLDGHHWLDGVRLRNNTEVEAEYSLTLSDGTSTWTVIAFNTRNSDPDYATIEGLAFIGGPGGFPPVGVPLTVTAAEDYVGFAADDYATPICYARGTAIATDRGARRIETLEPGDLIRTADNGYCPLRWIGRRVAAGVGTCAPVEIPAGRFGARQPVLVSQQHCVLIRHAAAELLFGTAEVFLRAAHLVEHGYARLREGIGVEYWHLALDRHEVIFAGGMASESVFAPGGVRGGLETSFFPELREGLPGHDRLARTVLRRHEAALLLQRLPAIDHAPRLRQYSDAGRGRQIRAG